MKVIDLKVYRMDPTDPRWPPDTKDDILCGYVLEFKMDNGQEREGIQFIHIGNMERHGIRPVAMLQMFAAAIEREVKDSVGVVS